MKTNTNGAPVPIAALAARIIDDVSELCERMAVINRHEMEPDHRIKGVKSGR